MELVGLQGPFTSFVRWATPTKEWVSSRVRKVLKYDCTNLSMDPRGMMNAVGEIIGPLLQWELLSELHVAWPQAYEQLYNELQGVVEVREAVQEYLMLVGRLYVRDESAVQVGALTGAKLGDQDQQHAEMPSDFWRRQYPVFLSLLQTGRMTLWDAARLLLDIITTVHPQSPVYSRADAYRSECMGECSQGKIEQWIDESMQQQPVNRLYVFQQVAHTAQWVYQGVLNSKPTDHAGGSPAEEQHAASAVAAAAVPEPEYEHSTRVSACAGGTRSHASVREGADGLSARIHEIDQSIEHLSMSAAAHVAPVYWQQWPAAPSCYMSCSAVSMAASLPPDFVASPTGHYKPLHKSCGRHHFAHERCFNKTSPTASVVVPPAAPAGSMAATPCTTKPDGWAQAQQSVGGGHVSRACIEVAVEPEKGPEGQSRQVTPSSGTLLPGRASPTLIAEHYSAHHCGPRFPSGVGAALLPKVLPYLPKLATPTQLRTAPHASQVEVLEQQLQRMTNAVGALSGKLDECMHAVTQAVQNAKQMQVQVSKQAMELQPGPGAVYRLAQPSFKRGLAAVSHGGEYVLPELVYLDNCSSITLVSESFARRLGQPLIDEPTVFTQSGGGKHMLQHKIMLPVRVMLGTPEEVAITLRAAVVPDASYTILLGNDFHAALHSYVDTLTEEFVMRPHPAANGGQRSTLSLPVQVSMAQMSCMVAEGGGMPSAPPQEETLLPSFNLVGRMTPLPASVGGGYQLTLVTVPPVTLSSAMANTPASSTESLPALEPLDEPAHARSSSDPVLPPRLSVARYGLQPHAQEEDKVEPTANGHVGQRETTSDVLRDELNAAVPLGDVFDNGRVSSLQIDVSGQHGIAAPVSSVLPADPLAIPPVNAALGPGLMWVPPSASMRAVLPRQDVPLRSTLDTLSSLFTATDFGRLQPQLQPLTPSAAVQANSTASRPPLRTAAAPQRPSLFAMALENARARARASHGHQVEGGTSSG